MQTLKVEKIINNNLKRIERENKRKIAMHATEEMQSRWMNIVLAYPVADVNDIRNENPCFNGGTNVSETNQCFPEYSQSSYLSMRKHEENLKMFNYLN